MTPLPTALVFQLEHDLKWDILRLHVRRTFDGDEREFILQHPDKGAKDIISDLREGLPDFLDPFRRAVGRRPITLSPEWEEAAAKYLDNTAGFLFSRLGFGRRSANSVDALREFIWPALYFDDEELPVIELRASTSKPLVWGLPLELLPLFEPPGSSEERKKGTVSERLHPYLGFRALIMRGRNFHQHQLARDHSGRVPVRIGAYRGTDSPGVTAQLDFFRKQKRFSLVHEWPDLNTVRPHMAPSGLAGLLNGAIGFVHLCCHLDDRGADQVFEFGPENSPLSVNLSQLIGSFEELTDLTLPAEGEALIFLNTCRSVALSAHRVSLLRELQRQGCTDIIGGEALLPDGLAAEFALGFYTALLRGMPAGRAMVGARHDLLRTHKNPGGLLYTLYGNPEIHLDTRQTLGQV